MSKLGIDVSSYQGTIDWAKVAKEKDFAILRCTSGKSNALDTQFQANLAGSLAQGMPIGVYRYGYATTTAEAKAEAEAVVKAISGYEMACGVWYDAEDSSQRNLSKSTLTSIIKAFREVVEAAGYWVGIYCNQDWYNNVLDTSAFDCPFWVARYGTNDGQMHTKPAISHELYAWQYTSVGKVSGISGNVDLDILYGEISTSGSTATTTTTTTTGGFDVSTLSNIKSGSTGAQVKSLQALLNGKNSAGLSVDGIAGTKTVAAIKAYQTAKSLTVDGIAGINTWTELLTT